MGRYRPIFSQILAIRTTREGNTRDPGRPEQVQLLGILKKNPSDVVAECRLCAIYINTLSLSVGGMDFFFKNP